MAEVKDHELEYLESLSAAVMQRTPRRSRMILFFWVLTVALLLGWSFIAKIDEIVRGQGEVVPFGENQVVQNLEGGIVEELPVSEGDIVKPGQVLVKIRNMKSESTYESNELKYYALQAKAIRLNAEIAMSSPIYSEDIKKIVPELVKHEKSLYSTDMKQLMASISVLKEQLQQKKYDLKEAKERLKHLKRSFVLIQEELKMSEPMVKEGVKSKVDFLKLEREASKIEETLSSVESSVPRLNSAIKEYQQKIEEAKLDFQSRAKRELNKTLAEMERVEAEMRSMKDTVSRSFVRSPVEGMVQKMYIHTIGGVVQPGMDLVEIVPVHQNLIAEIKVKPKDIAFVYPGQKAKVKFTAYDFSIYGGLDGTVISISPDTVTDEKGNTFYIVRVKSEKKHLGSDEKPLKIIPGMIVNVDIITGKKRVIDYLFKPMLKSFEHAFTEH